MNRWLPVPASSYAGDIDGIMILISVIVGVWLVIAEVCLIHFTLRFRRRDGERAAYLPGNTGRTMAWVLVPVGLVLACDFVIEAASGPVWDKIKVHMPKSDAAVRIVSRQWSWEFDYPGPDGALGTPDDVVAMNELHVPAGAIVEFDLRSNDTLHSLWIPALRLKQDAVPGRKFRGWFQATRPGTYDILCAQLCGAAHTAMKGTLYVDSPGDYQRWLASAKQGEESPDG
jgi:cytochrome c oxidase subunit 2